MTIDWYVYWVVLSGFVANIWLALWIGKRFGRFLYAAAAAASFTRFCWACGRVHGFKNRTFPSWIYAPQVWFAFLLIELGHPARSISHMGGEGVWNGIGDWSVSPVKEVRL